MLRRRVAAGGVPEFLAEEHEFRCGYAPRAMEYSLRSDTLFVGCKDGTITVVENLAGRGAGREIECSRIASRDSPLGEQAGHAGLGLTVRAMCEWREGWLLVARNDGRIDLLNWKEAKEEACEEPEIECLWKGEDAGGLAARSNPVTYMDWLDRSRLLVSFRSGGTRIVHCDEGDDVPAAAQEAFAAARRDPEPGIAAAAGICCAVPIRKASQWIWASQNGTVWVAEDGPQGIQIAEQTQVWPVGEAPGFITDYALIKPPDKNAGREEDVGFDVRGQVSRGAYIATDNGVYLLTWAAKRPRARRISLPGVGRMCMALTYYADGTDGFLWVSDSAGDAHLFWDQHGARQGDRSHWHRPNWRRSGIRHDASQVMLAYASWRTLDGRFVVGQARRNDYVVISRYKAQLPKEVQASGPEARLSLRDLLRHGTAAHLARRLPEEERGKDWPPDALLAELFEELGERPEELKILREFLGNPNAELACNVLRGLPAEEPERSGRAVELWNHALLGTIHRRGDQDGEALYLGIVRWLRSIAQDFTEEDTPQAEHICRAVEQQIIFARKWGVFGSSYARRRSAVKPLRVLAEQEQHARDLDHFAYRSLLFQRQVDLEHEDDRGQRAGRTAWDLRTLRFGDRLFLAVSWIWGGIELYEAVPRERAEGEGYRLDLWAVLESEPVDGEDARPGELRLRARNLGPEDPPPEREARDYGFSRAIVLGRCPEGGGHYLLAAPAQRPEVGDRHALEVWRLDLEGTRAKVVQPGVAEARCPLCCYEPENESVYSLLELEPGWVLAGLRGHGGISQVTLVEVGGAGTGLRCVAPEEKLAAAAPEGKAIARNRVWCLARDESSAAGVHEVFAGCGDGQVWRLEVPRRREDLEQGFAMKRTLVERLGTPVWALACRTSGAGRGRVRRIFAGGADGTIVAWQQLSPPQEVPPRFTTVWATWEDGGPISRVHCPDHTSGGMDPATSPMVLVLTQQGRGILFADRATIEETGGSEAHRRLRVPGERYARLELRAPVFASELLELPERLSAGNPAGAFARLATATSDGRIQIHTLHHPLYLQVRKDEYERLVEIWLGMVCEPGEGTAFGPFRLQRLRMAEAAYVASPVAPQVLVRGLLEREESKHWKKAPLFKEDCERQWLPRHLRPLLDLDLAWGRRDGRLDSKAARRSLELALERVFRMRDRGLFAEIVTVVLNRANRWLFEVAGHEDGGGPSWAEVKDFYDTVLDALDRSLQHWLGSPDRAEVRVRVSFAKQFTDGDTLWRLCDRIDTSEELVAILNKRIGTVRKLLVLGDPLLALETLRATNLSLIRFCRRLVEDGGRGERGWVPGDPPPGFRRQEAPWEGLKDYVKALSDYAARASHSSERVRDSLAHEIARSFALTVCACPSAAIRVAHWMSEAGLISNASPQEDRAAAVLDQLRLLELLGVPAPADAVELFRRATSSRREDSLDLADPFWESLPGPELNMGPTRRLAKIKKKVGEDNYNVIQEMKPYYALLKWIPDLAGQILGDASGIDLFGAKRLLQRLEQARRGDDSFRHSREFWAERLKELWKEILEKVVFERSLEKEILEPLLEEPLKKDVLENKIRDVEKVREILEKISLMKRRSDRVQPKVVLFSREIERWCQASLKQLEARAGRHEIFEPQYSIYRAALSQLRRAAGEFPYSAAIQKNIVLGVLGHGLLEALDEHVLELEEIAQALDPLLVWKHRNEGRPPLERGRGSSRAEHFAVYLLQRSHDAESIPKNLRTLQGLLSPGRRRSGVAGREITFRQDLLRDFWPESFEEGRRGPGWALGEQDEGGKVGLTPLELRFLRLTLKELDQNDRNYGPAYRNREDHQWPTVLFRPGPRVILRFALRSDLAPDDENLERLRRLKEYGLQSLIPRREARDVASHGTGLYLANLAAAVAGWRLTILDLEVEERWFSFLLEKVYEMAPAREER